jgi:VWFA-related protein
LLSAALLAQQQEPVPTFRSDVSLVRVDAQVLGSDRRAITGLRPEDFELREMGELREIRNFSRESMPADVLLLLDVSASMRPHVERIAHASRQAMAVLGPYDRVGIMVFDRSTRLKLPFGESIEAVEQAFGELLRQERFNGGTDITRALYDAARYSARNARHDARKAIVILTDDQTELNRDEAGVMRELTRADAVLSALLAPDAIGAAYPGGTTWPPPRRRGGILDDIIFGPRSPGGRGPVPPVIAGGRTRSAGTAEIARESGGDSLPVEDAQALEMTFARIRQRYALHFLVPHGASPGQIRTIQLSLAPAANRRYPGAELLYRRTYYVTDGAGAPAGDPEVVSSSKPPPAVEEPATEPARESPSLKRRRAVDGSGWPRGPDPVITRPSPAAGTTAAPQTQPPRGGWRRVTDPEPPPPPEEPKPEPPSKDRKKQ